MYNVLWDTLNAIFDELFECVHMWYVYAIHVYSVSRSMMKTAIVLLEIHWMYSEGFDRFEIYQWKDSIEVLWWKNLAKLKHLHRIESDGWYAYCTHCRTIKFNLNMIFIVPLEVASEFQFRIKKSIIPMDNDYGSEQLRTVMHKTQ